MTKNNQKVCFCTLSLGERYRSMAKQLAQDLEKYSPGTFLVVGTDKPDELIDCANILAFQFHQQGILHCFNDKRFVIKNALEKFQTAIYLDADTRIIGDLPDRLDYSPGIIGCHRNIIEHVSKYRSQDLENIKKVASKLEIPIQNTDWIGESLFAVTRDAGKEQEFLKTWGIIALYLELKGMHSGEGSIMGLAAVKVGWKVAKTESWESLNQIRKHLDASLTKLPKSLWQSWQKRLGYHYRLNKSRLLALKNFNFYYR
jgi:hypothetical protein